MKPIFFSDIFPIFLLFLFGLSLGIILIGGSFLLSVQKPDSAKVSPYECGFDPYEDSRNQFDVRYFIVAILFLLFDIETIFIFPWVSTAGDTGFFGFWVLADFLLELGVGFFYAWCIGAIEWE
jgi:NADH-quinone oxidoreductase subunit A